MMRNKVLAVVGDVHDHFDSMVQLVEAASGKCGARPDFVLQVGDFQANRHDDDLRTMPRALKMLP